MIFFRDMHVKPLQLECDSIIEHVHGIYVGNSES